MSELPTIWIFDGWLPVSEKTVAYMTLPISSLMRARDLLGRVRALRQYGMVNGTVGVDLRPKGAYPSDYNPAPVMDETQA